LERLNSVRHSRDRIGMSSSPVKDKLYPKAKFRIVA
jgi:hypothetical protein